MGRRSLGAHSGWDDNGAQVAYTRDAIRLGDAGADADLCARATELERLVETWHELDRQRREDRHAISRNSARVRFLLAEAHGLYLELHASMLAEVGRGDPRYRVAFPVAPSSVGRQSASVRLAAMRTALGSRAADGRATEAQLADALGRVEAELAGREALLQARQRRLVQIAAWRTAVNRALCALEGRLLILAAERGRSAAWVDLFFPATAYDD